MKPGRQFFLLLACMAVALAAGAAAASEARLWSQLQSGSHIILIRHAITEPGVGDPPGFRIGDCSTQRNLSAQGRADAERIGEAFRSRAIPVAEVLSSRWCRCIDTAQLAFGTVRLAAMLDSMFGEGDNIRQAKKRELYAFLARYRHTGNLVLVTHAQNISELTGISPGSGEMVIARFTPPGSLQVIGRIDVPRS